MTEVAAALHLTKDVLHERLMECRTTYKVNLGCGAHAFWRALARLKLSCWRRSSVNISQCVAC